MRPNTSLLQEQLAESVAILNRLLGVLRSGRRFTPRFLLAMLGPHY
jgi:hypothetical protein